ncbi:Uncharacterized conserved protein YbaA, DUF1428 family [Cognatiyoonia koreensis]|uniref:Uncharacterized conserved protein YbaA, DUF1428 family n=1 Tax=Cognatiyoonia koreensis TaxID=364200 RepID=A0A1I0R9W7_9RHOB|nr:DUF1428 family protein [Cognatiyoonia koreensis]SEW37584.1 Uncharacterized conserved protein YbaA, DUF1428 family [Cognatiyoonia koreensis]
MPFCDITIFPVAANGKEAYLRFSERMAKIYREFGASRVTDFWQDDDASADENFHAEDAMANYAAGNLPNFRKLAGAAEGETVVVSITEWPDREARDRGIEAVVSDARIQATMAEEPVFDGSKLIAGGFTVELDIS